MTGTYRQASPKMILEGVKPGTEQKVAFRAADGNNETEWPTHSLTSAYADIAVGDIESILLQNSAVEDPWFCETVRIATDGGSVASFTVKRWIGSPFQSAVMVTLRPSLDTDMSPQDVQCHTRGTDLVSMYGRIELSFSCRKPIIILDQRAKKSGNIQSSMSNELRCGYICPCRRGLYSSGDIVGVRCCGD